MSEKEIDRELVTLVKNGDRGAFDVLVLKYQRRIAAALSQKMSDKSMINDIIQDTFLKAFNSIDKFQGCCAFFTWIYTIAHNTMLNYMRIKKCRGTVIDTDFEEPDKKTHTKLTDDNTPEEMCISRETHDVVMAAVNELPEELRVSMILREMAGLSYEDISELLEIPIGTVRSRVFRARSVIDEHLSL